MLKFGEEQTFSVELSGRTVTLRFFNPKRISIPPAHLMVTALGIDTDDLLNLEELEKIRLRFNEIIRAYRLVTKETYNNGNITQISNDLFLKLVVYYEVDKDNVLSKPRFIQHIKKLEIGVISNDSYSEITRLVSSINLINERSNDEILLQAKSFLSQENYRMAVLEAVIALEITVSSLIRKRAKEEDISDKDVESFLFSFGSSSCLKVVLRLLIPESIPSETVLLGCKGAITIRNDIVHRARSSVTTKDAQDAINNIEMFINTANDLMK